MSALEIDVLEEGGSDLGSFGARVLSDGRVLRGSAFMGEVTREEELAGRPSAETFQRVLRAARHVADLRMPSQRFGPDPLKIADGYTETVILRTHGREVRYEATVGQWGEHAVAFRELISAVRKAAIEAEGN